MVDRVSGLNVYAHFLHGGCGQIREGHTIRNVDTHYFIMLA